MNNNNFNTASTRSPSGYASPGTWASPATSPVGPGRPPSLMDQQHSRPNVVRVVVNRDAGGYGMKVSGDNPVYVQSVKEGGPAEKAGLHAGDKILQVNGTNVVQSTHTDVVALIKAHAQVVLTVQQRSSPVRSPSTRPTSVPSSTRITAPRPVDNEKQYQLQQEKEQYYRLMIEKEQHHLDKLRCEVASSVNDKKLLELAKAEKNLRTLQDNLSRSLSEQHSPSESHCIRPISSPNNLCTPVRGGSFDEPPPLPKRNKHSDINSLFLTNEINANSPKRETASGDVPPPLPPRTYPPHNTHTGDASAANSIDKQMSYPLVATCTPLRTDGSANNVKHQRTKSSPDCLVGPADGGGAEPRRPGTPPGTPPPPYPSPTPSRKYRMGDSFDGSFDLMSHSESFVDNDRLTPHNPQPIRAANSRIAQQTIISMEDDDISDQEMDQAEDHGYFKSLSRLWEHLPHLAVFMNYILSSNSDPNSLLFYLLTDLYKEGNAKEMRKWAFEIHSCFLVPGAPLRLNNVDENIAREIDDDLTKVYEKEEIMRKIFWKARQRAKEELTRQLADLQQKRTAGLGSMYGPTDQELMEHYSDKAKETKLYESLFVPKVGLYLEEMEKDSCDPQKYYLAASLITILTRVFKILKGPQNQDLDRIPTFVNKDRSFKARLGVKFSRKLSHLNHQFSAQQYFTVTLCSYCHQIIYGISPQGYHCTVCSINLHRNCVKLYEDYCPGPFKGKEGRIKRLIGMRHENSEQNRQRKVSQFIQNEKEKRQQEEKDNMIETSENVMWSKQADTRGKNATSLKSKITSKKSKTATEQEPADNKQQEQQDKKKLEQQNKASCQKGGRNRTRNKNKKDAANNAKKKEESVRDSNSDKPNSIKRETEHPDECDGVVLRNPNATRSGGNTNVKRYSDSFVLENQSGGEEAASDEKVVAPSAIPLTRALSGFFVLDQSKKHNRRFSDLFRPASSKFSGSTESLKIPINLEKNVPEKISKAEAKERSKSNKKLDPSKKTSQTKSAEFTKPTTETSNSYLKRVRSKIYKSKSDDCARIELENKYKILKPKKSLDLNGRIPEEDIASPPGVIQKSLGHFHFGRLTRQTTNLEQISRPFGSQKSVENAQSESPDRPALAKSKSSSAINLSLLRARRAKLGDQTSAPLCRDEFDFIAFGNVRPFGSNTSLHKVPSWLHINKAESKVLHPVSRTGSDRRPDAVREECARLTDDAGAVQSSDGAPEHSQIADEKKEAVTPQESPANLHSSGAKRRAAGHINRSESVKEQSEKQIRKQQRRNVSDPSHSANANYDADNEPHTDLSKNTDSGSSSNSSISAVNGRLSESPSNSMDVHQATVRSNSTSDSDLEGETDPLNWQELVTEEELKKLNPNEKKRQEVINELFLTEASHVRMLKVLYKNFYKSLQNSQLLKPDEINLIFPNIKELLDIHTKFNNEVRQRRKDDPLVRQIGDMLLSAFSGPQGELLQKAAATFCERQQLALEFIKKRRERDNKFDSLLTECEKKRSCRRLQLQGIVPYEMQRLTRYPLLLERLIKSVEAAEKTCSDYTDELVKLRQAHQCSKEILGFVNEAAKQAHNKHRLEEIQRHLDVSNFRSSDHQIVNDFKNIDLTRYKLILEGGLQLRRNNKAPVQVHVLLMEEIVVILQKESEKFLLKFFQTGTPSQPPLSPIIKMNTLLVRENAVCKNALFLVNMSTNNSQMYDLCAEDEVKRETWLKHFSEASEAYSRREGKPSRIPAAPMVLPQLEPDADAETAREPSIESTTTTVKQEENQPPAEPEPAPTEENHRVEDPGAGGDQTPDATSGGGIHITSKVSAEEWPLIQPSQVNVQVPPVHIAESILTPLEQIRRKDALVKQTLAEKENLVADLLSIPREHFEHIADMASMTAEQETETQSDIVDRLLSSVFQVDMLQKAVNDALNVSEGDVIAAKGGKGPVCPGQEPSTPTTNRSVIPSVPATLVGEIAACLSKQLTTLLSEIRQVEEDRDRLRKELHNVREKLHAENGLHSPVPFDESGASDESAPEVFCEAISDAPI